MGSIINRVKQVATYYNTSVVKWEETLGLSPSHFYNIKAISRRTARNINKVYPELNIEWLITGKGEMLNFNVVLNRNTGYTVPFHSSLSTAIGSVRQCRRSRGAGVSLLSCAPCTVQSQTKACSWD